MKRKGVVVLTAALGLGLAAFLAYSSNYELRLVPNKPDLRPRPSQPQPQEFNREFDLSGGSERDNRGFPQREILDLSSMFPDLFFREGDPKAKTVALTFDDGPDSVYTPQILDILKAEKVKATFFLIGNRVDLFPEITKRLVDEGHIVGNHSMTHPNVAKLGLGQIKKEILTAEEKLSEIIGYKTALFRSPYGSIKADQVKEIGAMDYKIISWNVDSLDWKSLTAEQVKTNILENVREGSIILQHSAGSKEENLSGSVSALPEVIATLKKEGFKFVTIPELLDLEYEKGKACESR